MCEKESILEKFWSVNKKMKKKNGFFYFFFNEKNM